jgi:peptidoglycan/LPS O-acetylase OafA/YrhL
LQYNPAFDGVRALAVLAVVAYHCHIPMALGGLIGVDVFFVLSGFLITSILRAELDQTGDLSLGRFYWRRALRLWPPLLLMLAAYAIVAPVLFPDANVLPDVTLAALYLSDYAMAFWVTPLEISHTWSLAVEEHFYLIWPLVILATARMRKRRLAVLLATGFVIATMWRVADTFIGVDWNRTYYRFDTRLSGLILGGLVAVMPWRPSERQATWIGRVSVIVLAVSLFTLRSRTPAPLLWGGLFVDLAAAGLILSLVSGHATQFGRMLSGPWLVYLGTISYSVYLWHYPIARVLRDQLDPTITFGIVTALSIAIAALSWEYVEKPLKTFRRREAVAA